MSVLQLDYIMFFCANLISLCAKSYPSVLQYTLNAGLEMMISSAIGNSEAHYTKQR